MSRTLHLFGTDWCAMMVPIHALQWYRFADTVNFVFHKEQVTLSVIVCIVIAYVLGMISWIAGKQIRYWLMKHFWERDKDADFEFMFSEAATHFTFKD